MNPLAKIQGIRSQFENKDARDYERETLGLLQGRVNEMYSMTTIAKALQIAPIAACATLYGLLAAGKISGLDIPNLRAEEDDTYFFGIIQTEHWTGGFRVEGIAECFNPLTTGLKQAYLENNSHSTEPKENNHGNH